MIRETKVGIFIVCFIVMLLGMSMVFEDVNFFESKGMPVTFYVNDASGIVAASNVMYMGLAVGKVKEVSLRNGLVALDCELDREYQIPANVVVTVSQGGLIGDRYVELIHQTASPDVDYIQDGEEYYNYKNAVSIEELSEKLDTIADQVSVFMNAVNSTFSTVEGQENMRAILSNVRSSTENLNTILADNKEGIGNIVQNLDRLSATLDKVVADKDQDVAQMIDNLNAMSANLKNFSKNLDQVMSGEQENLVASIENIRELTDSIKISVDNINRITGDIDSGSGTIGMLIKDNETRDQLKNVVSTLSEATAAADRLYIELEAGLENFSAQGDYHGRFDVRIHPNDRRYYMIGVSNNPAGTITTTEGEYSRTNPSDPGNPYTGDAHYFEKTEKTRVDPLVFSLQYAMIFKNMFTVRAGILENRLGFGLDYQPFSEHKLFLTFEASDFFREKYGTYAKFNTKYYFHDNFFVQAGWNDLFTSRNGFTFGGGITLIDNDLKYFVNSVASGASGMMQ